LCTAGACTNQLERDVRKFFCFQCVLSS
jgi:hypothetical protein